MKTVFSTILFVLLWSSSLFSQVYQNETFISGTSNEHRIANFLYLGIDNYTIGAPPYYNFYTGPNNTTDVVAGVVFGMVLSMSQVDSTYYAAYMDFNRDGDFYDEGENVLQAITGGFNNPFAVHKQLVKIPDTVSNGPMRLRVICTYGQFPLPGLNYDEGETKDFEINVISPSIDPCTGFMYINTLATDSFDDGSGPAYYPPFQSCSWLIQPHDADTIFINLTQSEFSGAGDDGFSVFDGTPGSETTYLIGNTLSGILGTFPALSGTAFVSFHSGGYPGNLQGFEINYTTVPKQTPFCYAWLNPPSIYKDRIKRIQIANTSLDYFPNIFIQPLNTAYKKVQPAASWDSGMLSGGETYPLIVTTTINSSVSVWIDWNNNLDYEPSEHIQVATSTIPNVPDTVYLVIPAGIPNGQIHMRVRTRMAGMPNGSGDACTPFNSGQTVDLILGTQPDLLPPIAHFVNDTYNVINSNFDVDFTDLSQNYPTSWQWTFPGGTPATSTLQNPNVVYSTPGCYGATLIASNAAGSDTISYPCLVMVTPNFYCQNVMYDSDCDNGPHIDDFAIQGTDYNNQNTGCSSNSIYWGIRFWPTVPGPTDTLYFGQSYTADITTQGNQNLSFWIDFNRNGQYQASENLFLNHPSVSQVSTSVNFTLPASGTPGYTRFRLRSTNSSITAGGACSNTTNGESEDYIVYLAGPPVLPQAQFSTSANAICEGESVVFSDQSLNAPTSWLWNFQGGIPASSNAQQPPPIVYQNNGNYDVQLIVSNAGGSDTLLLSNTVVVNPIPFANAGSDVFLCDGDTVQLIASGGGQYNWSPNTNLNNNQIANPLAWPSMSTLYAVQVSQNNCSAIDSVLVQVFPNPAIPQIVLNGIDLESSLAFAYQWYLNGLQIVGANSQIYTPSANGNYMVEISDSNGCKSTSSVFTLVGLNNAANNNDLILFPNPATSEVLISMDAGNQASMKSISLLNYQGQRIIAHNQVNGSTVIFNVDEFAVGLYFFEVILADGTLLRKRFVKE